MSLDGKDKAMYNEDQPRGAGGKWSAEGASKASETATESSRTAETASATANDKDAHAEAAQAHMTAARDHAKAAEAQFDRAVNSKANDTQHFMQGKVHQAAAAAHEQQAGVHRAQSGTIKERNDRVTRSAQSRNRVEEQAKAIRQAALKIGDGRHIPGLQKSDFKK